MVYRLRPVMVPWTCHRTGDCCTSQPYVLMTTEEQQGVIAATTKQLTWMVKDGWAALKAAPCPLLERDAQGLAVCSVYDVRPYNCRRFACGRVSPETEPYETGASGECVNMTDRLTQSKPFRSWARRLQRQAQDWADAHGWRTDDAQ